MNEDFDIKTKIRLLTEFNKVLIYNDDKKDSIENVLKKYKTAVMPLFNSNSVILVLAKSRRAKELLFQFYNIDYVKDMKSVPLFKYTNVSSKVRLSVDYTNWIIKIFRTIDSDAGISISTETDKPATFENDDLSIMLAPRGED